MPNKSKTSARKRHLSKYTEVANQLILSFLA
jgi:hypothetical protein